MDGNRLSADGWPGTFDREESELDSETADQVKAIAQKLAAADEIQVLFYVFAAKFLDKSRRLQHPEQYEWLLPDGKERLLLLHGDVSGHGKGVGLSVEELSGLTSELVSNLYKTVGVIIGVLIAALIDPDKTAEILVISSTLYLFYLLVILFYQLRSVHIRFENEVAEYEHGVDEMRDILDKDEIERLEGDIFEQAKHTFTGFFDTVVAKHGHGP